LFGFFFVFVLGMKRKKGVGGERKVSHANSHFSFIIIHINIQ